MYNTGTLIKKSTSRHFAHSNKVVVWNLLDRILYQYLLVPPFRFIDLSVVYDFNNNNNNNNNNNKYILTWRIYKAQCTLQ